MNTLPENTRPGEASAMAALYGHLDMLDARTAGLLAEAKQKPEDMKIHDAIGATDGDWSATIANIIARPATTEADFVLKVRAMLRFATDQVNTDDMASADDDSQRMLALFCRGLLARSAPSAAEREGYAASAATLAEALGRTDDDDNREHARAFGILMSDFMRLRPI